MNKYSLNHFSLRSFASLLKLSGLALAVGLLMTGCATTQDPITQEVEKAHSEVIVLREGDVLRVSFPGAANLDTTQPIRRDGKIVMPLVGEVSAAGLTPDQLQDNLIKLYAPQIASKEVTVSLQSSSFPVFVTGAVVRPGKILSDHPLTALEAIMEAGGYDYTTADIKHVKIIRQEGGVMKNYILNLKLILDGVDDKPFYLKTSDIIFVPQRLNLF